jgi:class 3 adenylate cyclase
MRDSHARSLSVARGVGHDCGAMPRVQFKSLDAPDEVRRVPNGTIEIYTLDDIVIGRTVFQPGWHWATDVKPIAGTEFCQYHHVGVCISGRLGVRMADGTTGEVAPGTVFDIPPGHDGWVIGDAPWITYDVAGMRAFARVEEGSQRVLGAVLFTDIVDSTAMAERLVSTAWKALVDSHNERLQFELDRFRGRLVKTTGDGLLALFDGSERAVRAASAMTRSAAEMGVAIRAGVHTGEVEWVGGDIRGVAVHMAARVMATAGPGEVLVSATTHELLAGSGLEFRDAGSHELKGITGARQLYALVPPAV